MSLLGASWPSCARKLRRAIACEPARREKDGKPFVTDNGNFVLGCKYPGIPDPARLAAQLDKLVGVVDHGLFVGMAGRIVAANAQGKVRVIP